MVELTVTVSNSLGLHARAAAQLVRTANRFQSNVRLERTDGSARADAKSILSVLMLAASRGTALRAVAQGHDEQEAITALSSLFENGFREVRQSKKKVTTEPKEMRWTGLGVSEGLVVGRVLRLHNGTRHVYRAHIDEADSERELRRFRAAARLARRQLLAIKARAEEA